VFLISISLLLTIMMMMMMMMIIIITLFTFIWRFHAAFFNDGELYIKIKGAE
jgi:high-affinity Fe2+/Pb2+ permease